MCHSLLFCCCSVAESCLTLCDTMDYRMPGFPVLHHLPELAQTHVHWISDAILPSHPLLSPSPLVFSLSQHQGLFQWVGFSQQMAKVLGLQPQHQSFQWIFRLDFLLDWLVWSPCSPKVFQESSSTPQFEASVLQCSPFFIVQISHLYMANGKTIALTRWNFVEKVIFLLLNMLVLS